MTPLEAGGEAVYKSSNLLFSSGKKRQIFSGRRIGSSLCSQFLVRQTSALGVRGSVSPGMASAEAAASTGTTGVGGCAASLRGDNPHLHVTVFRAVRRPRKHTIQRLFNRAPCFSLASGHGMCRCSRARCPYWCRGPTLLLNNLLPHVLPHVPRGLAPLPAVPTRGARSFPCLFRNLPQSRV